MVERWNLAAEDGAQRVVRSGEGEWVGAEQPIRSVWGKGLFHLCDLGLSLKMQLPL